MKEYSVGEDKGSVEWRDVKVICSVKGGLGKDTSCCHYYLIFN